MIKMRAVSMLFVSIAVWSTVVAQDKLYSNEFPLGDVKLLDGPLKAAQDLNTKTLAKYNVDRLLYCYRSVAGLSTNGVSNYSNWAGLDGHVGGHYLSALAMNYAATGDAECKKRLDYMITELKKCQDANGNNADYVGFLCGMPNSKTFWNAIKGGNTGAVWDYWVPWYNIHKTYAGLRDVYVYTGNETAKTMFLGLCDWGINICSKLSDAQMQSMLGSEHGGMNEMYADAYQMTGTAKYLTAAKRFSHNEILNAAAAGKDNLDNKHANTQVPKVVGFQRIAEATNDNTYYKAAEFFWTTVTTKRSLALGGNSHNEFFPAASACMNYISGREGVETCNTNNMLKLTEGLFRMKPEAKYADFYERALYNHILSAIHPTHGGYVYFTPSHPRHYRVYSAPDVAMWCCVGTGMENPTKYGQFIYTNTNDSLYVNLFAASELTWKAKNCTLTQTTGFPDEEQTVLKVGLSNPRALTILIRHPYWIPENQLKILIDGDTVSNESKPSTYVAIARTWYGGEEIKVLLPMTFRYEPLINVPSYVAIMRGPILLSAKTGTDNLTGLIANADRMGHVPGGTLPDYNAAPKLNFNVHTFGSKMKPVAGRTLTYRAPELFVNKADSNLVFEPFFRIHDARYMTYWNATIATDVKEQLNHVSILQGNAVMSRFKGGVTVSFASEDPSRHITLYRLNGTHVLDVTASSRNVSLNYSASGLRCGVYTVKIQSDKMQLSKMLTIAEN